MSSVYFLLLLPGLMAGLLLWTRIYHLVLAAIGITYGMRAPAPTKPMSMQKQMLLLGTFVGSWLLVFAALAYYLHKHVGSPGWPWFFSGVAATPGMVLPLGLSAWLRGKRRRSSGT